MTGDAAHGDATRDDATHDEEATRDRAEDDAEDAGASSHLDDVEDGAGCTEIWERLSERREE